MGKRVKGIIVELGGDATGLNKAIASVTKEARDTQSELKKIDKLLKLDPKNITLLKQKQDLLNESIDKTEDVLRSFKASKEKADADMANGTEINEKAYRELERQIEANEITLRDARKQAEKLAAEMRDIDAGNLRDVENAADKAADALQDASKQGSVFGDVLKAEVLSDAAGGLIDTMKDLSEETREYRKIMASLEVSSEAAGYSAEQTEEAYKRFYGILADDQSTATATANLQALNLNQGRLMQLIDASIGAWSRYGDSISIDSLAEAINHSAQLGEVQSSLADVLEWAGLSVDDFNAKLQTCNSTSERADAILMMMANQGLLQAGKGWRENNQSMVEANEAGADLQEQMAQLGEKLEPLTTKLTTMITAALEWFNSLDSGTQNFILGVIALVAVIGPLSSAFGGMSSAVNGAITILPKLKTGFTAVMGVISANPIIALTAAIIGLVVLIRTKGDEIQGILEQVDTFLQGVFVTDWTTVFGPVLGNILNGFFANLKNIWDAIYQIFNGVIDFIRGVFTGDWERAWLGVKEIFSGVFDGLLAIAEAPINGIITLLNIAIDGVNWLIGGLNKIPGVNLGEVGSIPMLASGGTVWSGSAIVGDGGPELLTVSGGKAVVTPLTPSTGKIESLLGSINGQLAGASSGGETTIIVPLYLDGQKVGQAAAKYMRQEDRASGR